MSKHTGGPAFPTNPTNHDKAEYGSGMTLRDYFAAKAMQGAIACDVDDPETVALYAYKVADSMLKARSP